MSVACAAVAPCFCARCACARALQPPLFSRPYCRNARFDMKKRDDVVFKRRASRGAPLSASGPHTSRPALSIAIRVCVLLSWHARAIATKTQASRTPCRTSGAATPPSTDDMRILDAKRHLGCVFHLRPPCVSTMIGFSKKIQSSLDGCPASFDSP